MRTEVHHLIREPAVALLWSNKLNNKCRSNYTYISLLHLLFICKQPLFCLLVQYTINISYYKFFYICFYPKAFRLQLVVWVLHRATTCLFPICQLNVNSAAYLQNWFQEILSLMTMYTFCTEEAPTRWPCSARAKGALLLLHSHIQHSAARCHLALWWPK